MYMCSSPMASQSSLIGYMTIKCARLQNTLTDGLISSLLNPTDTKFGSTSCKHIANRSGGRLLLTLSHIQSCGIHVCGSSPCSHAKPSDPGCSRHGEHRQTRKTGRAASAHCCT